MNFLSLTLVALLSSLNQTDWAYISIEQAFEEAAAEKNRSVILCLQPKLLLARKLITTYNSRELSSSEEKSVERDLFALHESAQKCAKVAVGLTAK
jgi:hypothetical protein